MFDWDEHDPKCEWCQPTEGYDPEALTKEKCIGYALHFGYYSREQIEALWPADDDVPEAPMWSSGDRDPKATEFFIRYAQLKSSDEQSRPCACGGHTEFFHPWFGITGGFGPMGACTCD